MNELINII